MYWVIWEYQVKPACQQDFERIYSPNGLWAKLFQRGAGYLNTELLHDPDRPRHYLTIDRWVSSDACDSFHARWKDDYEALDQHCKNLTERESRLGAFTSL